MNSNKSKIHLKVNLIKGDLSLNQSNKEVKKIQIQESYEDMIDKCLDFLDLSSSEDYCLFYHDEQDKMYIENEEDYRTYYDGVTNGEIKSLTIYFCKKGINVDLGKSFQLNNTSLNISQDLKLKDGKNEYVLNKDNDDNANNKDDLKKENDRYKSNINSNINANNDFLNEDKINVNKNDVSNEHHDNVSSISKYSEPNQINKVGGDIVANSQDFSNRNPLEDSKKGKEYSFNPNNIDEEDFCLIKDDKNSDHSRKNNKNNNNQPNEEIKKQEESINEKSVLLEQELQKLKDKEAEIKRKAMAELIKKNRLNNVLLSSSTMNNNKNDNKDSKPIDNQDNNNHNNQKLNPEVKKEDAVLNNKEKDLSENLIKINEDRNVNPHAHSQIPVLNNQEKLNHKINISFDNNNYLGVKDLHTLLINEVSGLLNNELEKFKLDLNAKINSKISIIVNHFYSELSQRIKQSGTSNHVSNNFVSNPLNEREQMINLQINNNQIKNINVNSENKESRKNENVQDMHKTNMVNNNPNINNINNSNNNNNMNDNPKHIINDKGNSYNFNLLSDNSMKSFNINDLNKNEMDSIFTLKETISSKSKEDNDSILFLLFKNNSRLSINLSTFNLVICSNTEDFREISYKYEVENNKQILAANERFGIKVYIPRNCTIGKFKIYFQTNKSIKSDFTFLEVPIVNFKLNEDDYIELDKISEIVPDKSIYEIAQAFYRNNRETEKTTIYLINQ